MENVQLSAEHLLRTSEPHPGAPLAACVLPRMPLPVPGNARRYLGYILREIRYLFAIIRHPDTPWFARVILFFPVAYLCSPVQLLPNFVPVLGQLDDLAVIWLATKISNRLIAKDLQAKCREKPE